MFKRIRRWLDRPYNPLPPLTDEQIDLLFDMAWDDIEVSGIRTPYGDSQKEYFREIITRDLKELNNDHD